jgi:hypothetical protein
MTSTSSPSTERRSGKGRLVASIVLLVVAIIATPLLILGAWVRAEITDTDRYVDTVAPLADDPQVQQYIADQLAAAFNTNVDLKSFLAEELPAQLQPLGPTIATAVQGFVSAAAARFTASPAFKTIWVDANRAAHKVVSGVLTGDRPALDLNNGQLSLDLGDALRALQARLVESGLEVAGRVDLSGVQDQVVLADGPRLEKLEKAREAVGLLNDLVWVLAVVALVAAVGSVVVARRRAAALLRLGIGLAVVVLVIAVGVAFARRQFLDAIEGGTVPTAVAGSFFDAIVDSIRFAFRAVFVLSVVMAALVAITSLPSYARRWARVTQVAVALLGAAILLAANDLTWGLVLAVVVLVVAAEIALEVIRRRGLESPPGDQAAEGDAVGPEQVASSGSTAPPEPA